MVGPVKLDWSERFRECENGGTGVAPPAGYSQNPNLWITAMLAVDVSIDVLGPTPEPTI